MPPFAPHKRKSRKMKEPLDERFLRRSSRLNKEKEGFHSAQGSFVKLLFKLNGVALFGHGSLIILMSDGVLLILFLSVMRRSTCHSFTLTVPPLLTLFNG
ncbi:hypothetical protein HU200_011952 [Digitaria exilis]|uniref:Uncharacterized protein n=1 Tax=Digitaria exilis TaxID=1010633 RepID=A0A835KQ73_9POAL|nr:hypothetical protein HU200_011952 [Digitaria exilis]